MMREEFEQIKALAREIAKEEIAKELADFVARQKQQIEAPAVQEPPKPISKPPVQKPTKK